MIWLDYEGPADDEQDTSYDDEGCFDTWCYGIEVSSSEDN